LVFVLRQMNEARSPEARKDRLKKESGSHNLLGSKLPVSC
jgi:hypothetical protein